MKTKTILPLLFALTLFGCANQEVQGTAAAQVRNFVSTIEPGLRPAAKVACSFYLTYAATEKDRADLRANIYTVSSIIAGATGDLSPGDLSKQIQAALGKATPENKNLADGVAGAWAIAVPFVKGDPALLIKVTGDLAAGCVDATKQ